MLLNKIPCLDKGYVALIDSSNPTSKLRDLDKEFFCSRNPSILKDLGHMTVVMKCPLFVQLNLSKFNLKIMTTDETGDPQAFVPNPGEVRANSRELCNDIADDIARTTDALMINPKAYTADGADHFVSQILTPISVYTTIIVHGPYSEWYKYISQSGVPIIMGQYVMAIQQIMDAEWKWDGQN